VLEETDRHRMRRPAASAGHGQQEDRGAANSAADPAATRAIQRAGNGVGDLHDLVECAHEVAVSRILEPAG
jgi:hypothetical protein